MSWSRRYPPLAVIGLAVVLAIFTLPSALNLPQANPGQLAEYAPVPGSGQNAPQGNVAALGLGQGGQSNGNEGLASQAGATGAATALPSVLDCVGNPPRQTEDPFSPPCVPSFRGDNGGATYQGVGAKEIRILIYLDGNDNYVNGSGQSGTPAATYYDLWQAPQPGEHFVVTNFRVWQAYFSSRYQTYGRRAHFFLYFSSDYTPLMTPSQILADAAGNYATVHPFAVLAEINANPEAYLNAMAGRGVMAFSAGLHQASFYSGHPNLVWGFLPPAAYQASTYAHFVCTQVAPYHTSFDGNPGESGVARKYGYIYTTDPAHPEERELAQDILSDLKSGCGIVPSDTATFPLTGHVENGGHPGSYAQPAMAQFQQDHVTTILWGGGYETQFSHAAGSLVYHPEWIVAGDMSFPGLFVSSQQDQVVWNLHALVETPLVYRPQIDQQPCAEAFHSVDPSMNDALTMYYACSSYEDLRQLFTGVQIGGPHLTPTAVAQGFHAIPPLGSSDPQAPACFYPPGDQTCVKDAVTELWNSSAQAPSSGTPHSATGCYQVLDGGRRHLSDQWPHQDALAGYSSGDPCTAYESVSVF